MEQEVVTVGLDLAKNVFQVHAIAADGAVLIRRKLRRAEVIRFFAEFVALLGRHGSLRICASLGAGTHRDRP
jgi:transposase